MRNAARGERAGGASPGPLAANLPHHPIDLFEDIADPRDWEALVSVEAKTNPRIRFEIGDLGKVPSGRRVAGPGATYVMAPFVDCSQLRRGQARQSCRHRDRTTPRVRCLIWH